MDQRAYNLLTAGIFTVVAVVHLLRIVFGWPAAIGGLDIPQWASWLALVAAAALAWIGFRQNLPADGAAG